MVTFDIRKAKECNGDYSIYLSFPYNDTLVSLVRSQPTRYWHKDTKEWEVPYKYFSTLLDKMTGFDVEIKGEFTASKALNKPVVKDITGFNFKTEPFTHQIEGFNFGVDHERWLLADEQGLGKTKQVIDIAIARKLSLGYKHCLIICGVNGLKWNWKNEVKTHSSENAFILGERERKGKTYISSNKDKLNDLEQVQANPAYFLITNVESLRDEAIAAKLAQLCKNGEISMVAIDEIHKCKNPSSQQGKGILKLQPDCRVAMTGTPLMNTPMDLFIVLKWLGYEKHPFYKFKQHHCVMGGYGGYEVVGYKNLDELQDTLNEIMLRRLKDDVLDLPEKLYVDEFVEMTGKQAQVYKEVSMDIKANIDKIKIANNPLAELIRLRQATGYTGILSTSIHESAKLDRLEELVEEAVSNGKKVVIFSNWTQMTHAIEERICRTYESVVITGETKDADRQHYVEQFQNNPSVKTCIGTIGAMGTGLTLTAGSVVIFMDEPWTMAAKQQAIDRCHRIGTKSNVTVYTMMCKDTIDERIHDIVEKKGMMSDAIVDGKVAGNKAELLNFLLS